ncbi:hypothetical protein Tco_0628891 [Tanacetum coccineum]|uniref:Uncharacterized protein n=1 Tax=Tanacetum coccineum TaxID=301880 RepID=A0ABQ4WRL1_9ASTR
MIREQDEEEKDEKSDGVAKEGKNQNDVAPKPSITRASSQMNHIDDHTSARNALGSNQKESSSYEYQQSLMPKGITPIAVRTSRESQTWVRDLSHEEHQFTILWSSRHFLRLHLKVKNVESQKEASEIGKFRQMDETVVAVVADIHSEGTTDLIAGGAAIADDGKRAIRVKLQGARQLRT